MNKLVKELCIQSGAYEYYEVNEGVKGDDLPMQKFAELIVRKCADVCKSATQEGQPLHLVSLGYSQRLKEHFGVEE